MLLHDDMDRVYLYFARVISSAHGLASVTVTHKVRDNTIWAKFEFWIFQLFLFSYTQKINVKKLTPNLMKYGELGGLFFIDLIFS